MTIRSAVVVVVVALLVTSSAHAAVSVGLTGVADLDDGIISLSARVTANGGETADSVFGALVFPSSLVAPIGTAVQQTLPGGGWIPGSLSCNATRCVLFNQASMLPTTANVTNFEVATISFQILPTVPSDFVLTFSWQTTPSSQRLDFFGVTSAPGVSFTVINYVVPEPATGALLGVGLLALALRARHRA